MTLSGADGDWDVVVTSTMSSGWNIKDINAKYSSNPAKFRDLIRALKQGSDLG